MPNFIRKLFSNISTVNADTTASTDDSRKLIETVVFKYSLEQLKLFFITKTDLLNKIYPVGSIYISNKNINPSTFIGGVWEYCGQNSVLIGAEIYNIAYSLDGGILPNDAVTCYNNKETTILPTPTKNGYNFLGWKIEDTTSIISNIPVGTRGNLSLIATWEKIKLQATLEIGSSFNSHLKTFSNVGNIKFTNDKVPDNLKNSSIIVSDTGSVYKIYMYQNNGTTYISPELDDTIIYANKNSDNLFMDTTITSVNFENFNTSFMESFSYVFKGTPIVNIDLSSFNASKIKKMDGLCAMCSNLTNVIFGEFDTANLTNIEQMFSSCPKVSSELTIRNPNIVVPQLAFYNCSTASGVKFIINYTTDTESKVEEIISKKNSASNIVKGINIDLIQSNNIMFLPEEDNSSSQIEQTVVYIFNRTA